MATATVAYYATYHNDEGYALRAHDRRCFFLHDGQVRELTDADIPHLVLNGRVDLVEAQHLADALHGSLYDLVDVRNAHRPLAA